MDIENDETATDCLRTACYLTGVAGLSLMMAVWMLGLAVWRGLNFEW